MASNQANKKRGQKLSLRKKENSSKSSATGVLPNLESLNESSEFVQPKKGKGLIQATPFASAVDAKENVGDLKKVSCQVCSKDLSHMNSQRQLQHVNRCIDRQEEGEKSVEKEKQLLNLARNLILDCPICGKVCNTELSRKSHLKKCRSDQGVSTDRMLQLVKDQELERETLLTTGVIPPNLRSKLPKASASKKRKLKEPKNQFEEDVQVAMAISSSLTEQMATEVSDRGPVGRNKKGKAKEDVYTLLLTTDDERMARIQQKVSSLLSQQPCPFEPADTLPPSCLRVPSPTPGEGLWDRGGSESLPMEQFYVGTLMPPVTAGTMTTGPKLRPPSTTGQDTVQWESELTGAPGVEIITASTQTAVVLAELAGDSQVVCNLSRSGPAGAGGGPKRAHGSPGSPGLSQGGDCSQGDLGASGFCVQQLVLKPDDQERLVRGLCEELSSLVNNQEFSDVKVQSSEGVTFHAHLAILGSRCRKLVEMVDDGVIKLSASSATVFKFLRYLYVGELSLTPHLCEEFCTLADTLNLKELRATCCRLSLEEVTGGAADDDQNNDNEEFVESQIDLKEVWGESDTDDDTVNEAKSVDTGDASAQSCQEWDYDREDCRDVAGSQWKHAASTSLDRVGNEATAGTEVSSENEASDMDTGHETDVNFGEGHVSCGDGDVSDFSDGSGDIRETSAIVVCGHADVDGGVCDVEGGGGDISAVKSEDVLKNNFAVNSQVNEKAFNTLNEGNLSNLSEKWVIDNADNLPSPKRIKLMYVNTVDPQTVIDLSVDDDEPVETSKNTSTMYEQSSIDLFASPSPPRERTSVIPKGSFAQDSLNNFRLSSVTSPDKPTIQFSTPVEASDRAPHWKGRLSTIPHAFTPTSNKHLHSDTLESHGLDTTMDEFVSNKEKLGKETTMDEFVGNKEKLGEVDYKCVKQKSDDDNYSHDGSNCAELHDESEDEVEIIDDNLDDVSYHDNSGLISYSPSKISVDNKDNSSSPTFNKHQRGDVYRNPGQDTSKTCTQKLHSTIDSSVSRKYSSQLRNVCKTDDSDSDKSEVVLIDTEGESDSCHGNTEKVEDHDVLIDDGNATFTNEDAGVWDDLDDPGVCYEPPVQSPGNDYDVGYEPPVQSQMDQDTDEVDDGQSYQEDDNMVGVQFSDDDDSFVFKVDKIAVDSFPTNMNQPVAANTKTVSSFATPSLEKKSAVGKQWVPPSPFTPMPNYPGMATPALKKEVQKFGVKPVGKKRMIKVLVDIYQQTHQYETDSEVEDEGEKSCGHVTEGAEDSATSREDADVTPSQGSRSADSDNDVLEESCLHFDDSDSQSSPTKNADLPRKLTEFIEQHPVLHTRILMYEPLELDILKSDIKAVGIKCSMDKLMDFLDERCIAFTSKNSRKRAPQKGGRGHKPVKKTDKQSSAV